MAYPVFKLVKTVGVSPGTENDTAGNPAFVSTDAHEASPLTKPVAVPALVTDPANYSFENWLRLELTSAPDNNVTNIKVWGPSTQPGADTKVTDYIGTTATYVAPTASASTVATDRIDTTRNSIGTALAVGGTLVNVGDQSDFFVLQRKVEFGAGKGTVPDQVLNYQYTVS